MSEKLEHDAIDDLVGQLEEVTDDISDVSLMDVPVLMIFSVLFIIVALQFFTRYVLNDSLGWTEEIARYFLILLGFVGSITCVAKGKHIFLEFAYHYLPGGIIKPIVVLVEALVASFWGYTGWLAIELSQRTNSNMVSIALPKAYIYNIVSAACFLMAVFAALNLLKVLKKPASQVVREKLQQAIEGQ